MIASSVSPFNQRNSWVFDPRANLPLRQNSLWKLESGAVRTITWLEDGTLVTLGLWGHGEFVGKALARVQPYQIECLTQVKATLIPLTESLQLTELLLAHIQQMQELTVIRGHKKTDIMLIKLLSWLGQKFGREAQTGQLIDLRLTHQDIADILGSTRVTITRILSQLEQQGIIARYPLHRIILREEAIWHYEI